MLMRSIDLGQLDTSMAAVSDLTLGGTQRVGVLFTAIAGAVLSAGPRSVPGPGASTRRVRCRRCSACWVFLTAIGGY
jgi:hypothetical protein